MAEELEAQKWKYSGEVGVGRKLGFIGRIPYVRDTFVERIVQNLRDEKNWGLRSHSERLNLSTIERMRGEILVGLKTGLDEKPANSAATNIEDRDFKAKLKVLLMEGGHPEEVIRDIERRVIEDINARCRLREPVIVRSFRHYTERNQQCADCGQALPHGSHIIAWTDDYRSLDAQAGILQQYTRAFTIVPHFMTVHRPHKGLKEKGFSVVRTRAGIYTFNKHIYDTFVALDHSAITDISDPQFVPTVTRADYEA